MLQHYDQSSIYQIIPPGTCKVAHYHLSTEAIKSLISHKSEKRHAFDKWFNTSLHQSLEFISSVSESSHSVHIEGVFSLTNSGYSVLLTSHFGLFVSFPTVILKQKQEESARERALCQLTECF